MRTARFHPRIGLSVLALGTLLTGCASTPGAPGGPARETWLAIFNGKDLHGWQGTAPPERNAWLGASKVSLDPGDPTRLLITKEGDGGILVNGPKGKTCNIYSTQTFGDCEAHIEFMVPKGSNSGIYFMGKYELQVFDSYGKAEVGFVDCGGIYARWVDNKDFEGHAPRVNASRKPGEWQTFDVTFRAPRFDAAGKISEKPRFVKILHNGQVIHESVELNGPTRSSMDIPDAPKGPILLQGDHGPVAYRNLLFRPID